MVSRILVLLKPFLLCLSFVSLIKLERNSLERVNSVVSPVSKENTISPALKESLIFNSVFFTFSLFTKIPFADPASSTTKELSLRVIFTCFLEINSLSMTISLVSSLPIVTAGFCKGYFFEKPLMV